MPGSGYTVVAVKNGETTLYPGIPSQAEAQAIGTQLVQSDQADSFTVRPSQPSDFENLDKDQE